MLEMTSRAMKNILKLYLVTDRELSLGRSLEKVVSEAVAGGVTIVQLREKDASTGEFVELAFRLKDILRPYNVPLIINDRVDVALAVDAEGLHIGQSDMPYEIARKLLGPDKIIGLSVENMDDILEANKLDVDYVGISPVYGTPTKTDTAEPFGLEGLRRAVELSVHPTVAIGGMNAGTIADVMTTGADGVAVVSAICSAENVREAATELKTLVDSKIKRPWSQEVWKKSSRIYDAILELDFLKELSDGSLDNEIFSRYIAQDEIYLKNYYHQMNMLAEMMTNEQDMNLFITFAQSGMEGEAAMHDLLINRYSIDTQVESSKVTSDYNAHICEGIATGNPCIALAAVLPCMWIYNRVGLHILTNSTLDGNQYKEWILEYGHEEFTIGVNQVLQMIDAMAAVADEQTRQMMDYYYLKSALYEYAFWDYGYCGNTKLYDYTDSLEEWL